MRRFLIYCYSAVVLACAGCGGGGGGSRPPAVAPVPQGAGSAIASRISGTAYTQLIILRDDSMKEIETPLEGADIKCGEATGRTDAGGKFTLLYPGSGKVSCAINKKGYMLRTITIDLTAGGAFNATSTILLPVSSGTIEVKSGLPGAPVSIDGLTDPFLTTGTWVSGVPAGPHVISAASEGYEDSGAITVSVAAGATATAMLDLVMKTTGIEIELETTSFLAGETAGFAAKCGYFDESTAVCTEKLSWDSSDTLVGTMAEGGIFKALSPGETTISATRVESRITHPGVKIKVVCPADTSWVDGSCRADSLSSITILSSGILMDKGNSAELSAECVWKIAGAAPCPEIEWIVSDQSVASVSSGGVVTGIKTGVTAVNASSPGVSSNQVTVTVNETRYPDMNCDGAGGFCLDVVSSAATGGNTIINVAVSNPPASGLGSGIVTMEWEPGMLSYVSSTSGGVVDGMGDSAQDGQLVFAFSSAAPVTENTIIFSVEFSLPPGISEPVEIKLVQSRTATNFTDYGLNLISQNGISFRNGFAGP